MKKETTRKPIRIKTNQAGVYKNTKTKKYDVKYCYTDINPLTVKKEYKQKWLYGINSYKEAVQILNELKGNKARPSSKEITLKEAYDLWVKKAEDSKYSPVTIRNTRQQFQMIMRFWSEDLPIVLITEENYLNLIAQCREYGYSEETVWNINACLRKIITLAYKNRYLAENPIRYWDTPRIQSGVKRNIIPFDDLQKIGKYFDENEFYRMGENHYPKYKFLFYLLYYTGMRIGEAIALTYEDFETYTKTPRGAQKYMRVSVTKSYNSAYKLLKGTKNSKTRKIPLPKNVIDMFQEIKKSHIAQGGASNERIFPWEHGACNGMLRKACRCEKIKNYNCHDFRHTYISNLIYKGIPLPIIEEVSGDVQATILKRYSHMFEGDEEMVLEAFETMI